VDPETIDYPKILQDALRDAVRRVLAQVAEHGLPGEHYFSIGFRTDHPGVEVPRFLREQYPEEIVIILQHQFWGLTVEDDAFSVLLSFGGSRQPLVVPFAALTAFVDPTAQFALRFVPAGEEEGEEEAATAPEAPAEGGEPARPGEVLRFDPSRKR
jgi:hypothetical protein